MFSMFAGEKGLVSASAHRSDASYHRSMVQARRVSSAALLLLPAGLVLYFAFNSGGFYPDPPAYVAVLLCIVLLVRLAMSATPFAGLSWQFILAASALTAFSLFTLASGLWSHAPGLARVEFDLPLVYLLAMVLFGSMGRTRTRLRWMFRALAAASLIVCGCGLITRLLPHVWPISPEIANDRLSFPVTYWNALGLLATFGVVLCFHLSSDLREPRTVRVLAAAAVPLLVTTLYFTFSRGAIAVCILGLVVYLLIGRPRGLLSSLTAVAPTTVVALKFAYDANLLATPSPITAGAVAQGRHVAVAVGASVVAAAMVRVALAASLDLRLLRMSLQRHLRALRGRSAWVPVAAAALIAIVALRGTIAHQYHRFVSPTPTNLKDFRARLTDPANNGRIYTWRVAWHQFQVAPVAGHGAGTYANTWAQYRPVAFPVEDAHSLYLETLDELGVGGLALLLIAIVTVLARVAARARGSGRSLYAAVLAVLLAWTLHAGVDWDWEMPVVTLVFFSLGGLALGRRLKTAAVGTSSEVAHDPSRQEADDSLQVPRMRLRGPVLARVAVGLALIPLGVLPAYVWLSQRRLDDANYAFSLGDCRGASLSALSSISILGDRAEPYEVLSYCDSRLGDNTAALAAIDKAVSLDSHNWNYRYDKALMLAAAGHDPRSAVNRALSLNPRETLIQEAWHALHLGGPVQWRAYARGVISRFTTL